jgi:hypothetical protein
LWVALSFTAQTAQPQVSVGWIKQGKKSCKLP